MARKAGNLREKFIIEYLIDQNATQAAIRSGYSPKTARSQGQRLLTNADIRTQIDKKLEEQLKRIELTADYVLTSLIEVAERCRQAVPVLDREGNETGEYKFDSTGANKALELLGKHLKLFTDKLDINVADYRDSVQAAIQGICATGVDEQTAIEMLRSDPQVAQIVEQGLASEKVQ